MRRAPLVVLEPPFEARIEHIRDLYVERAFADHERRDPEHGFDTYAKLLRESLDNITKRLGGAGHAMIRAGMEAAIAAHRETGDTGCHREWIAALLRNYYDPMYDFQLDRVADRVVYRGDVPAVRDYLIAQGLPLR
jgi:tRNA 2-selenouridine synthase